MNAGTVHGRVATVQGTVLEIDVEGPVPPLSIALRCRLSDNGWVTAVVHAHSAAEVARCRALLGVMRGRLPANA